MTAPQKQFFQIWNHFVVRHVPIPVRRVPNLLLQFVQEHAVQLEQEGLADELTCHLCNCWDEGHMSATHMTEIMTVYHQVVSATKDAPMDV